MSAARLTALADDRPPERRTVAEWHASLAALAKRPSAVPAGELAKHARRIRVDVREADAFLPLARRTVAEVGRDWPDDDTLRDAAVARLTGLVTAWAASQFAPLAALEGPAVLAALLADSATLAGRGGGADDPTHPAVAAAWLAEVADLPVVTVRAVARHHERSDGTGRPAAMTAERLSLTDRLVSVAARFAELVGPVPTAVVVAEAGAILDREARCGEFDITFAAALLEAVGVETGGEETFLDARPATLGRTDFGRRRLRADAAHDGPAGPHVPPRYAAPGRGGRVDVRAAIVAEGDR